MDLVSFVDLKLPRITIHHFSIKNIGFKCSILNLQREIFVKDTIFGTDCFETEFSGNFVKFKDRPVFFLAVSLYWYYKLGALQLVD